MANIAALHEYLLEWDDAYAAAVGSVVLDRGNVLPEGLNQALDGLLADRGLSEELVCVPIMFAGLDPFTSYASEGIMREREEDVVLGFICPEGFMVSSDKATITGLWDDITFVLSAADGGGSVFHFGDQRTQLLIADPEVETILEILRRELVEQGFGFPRFVEQN
jgi:hypothetical protein